MIKVKKKYIEGNGGIIEMTICTNDKNHSYCSNLSVIYPPNKNYLVYRVKLMIGKTRPFHGLIIFDKEKV